MRSPREPVPTSLATRWLGVLCVLSLLGVALGCLIGSSGWQSVAAVLDDPVGHLVVWEIRLPRSLGAWVGGALLALAGAVAQGLFRNPLADPYLLGSASGATLGWVAGLGLLGQSGVLHTWPQQIGLTAAAFVGAWLAVLLTLVLARGAQHSVRLLLSGVVVSVMLGAVTQLLSQWHPQGLMALQGFLLGSAALLGWTAVHLLCAVWMLCMAGALWHARVLDALSLGTHTAESLGLSVHTARLVLLAVFALATASAVSQMGLIAFVGLAAPHAVRALVSTPHRMRLWLSSIMGGVLLVWADLLARGLVAPQELPVGVLTAVLGGGYLLWLMYRQQGPSA